MTNSTITKTVFFDAPRETVWAFLTEREKLAQWFHKPEKNLSEGEAFCLFKSGEAGEKTPQIWGKVVAMDPPNTLVYTFICKPFGENETKVSYELVNVAGGTKLTLVHEGVVEASGENALSILQALDKGWDEHLHSLRNCVV